MKRSAFTIIELMVAVMIIALISAFATANFLSAQRTARDNTRKATAHTIATAVENFYAVKRTFPGRIDATLDVGGAPTNLAAYNLAARGCQTILDYSANGEYPYIYSFVPYSSTQGCDNPPTQVPNLTGPGGSVSVYTNSDFSPSPSWIPGLSEYLSPIPQESRFSDPAGNGPATIGNPPVSDLLTASNLRTLQYRRLQGGYMVSVKLESTAIDQESLPTGTIDSQPYLPKRFRSGATGGSGVGVTNTNVYAIRK